MANLSRRLGALLLCCLLIPFSAMALVWPASLTEGQQALVTYVEAVNNNLTLMNTTPINTVFDCYQVGATLGITAMEDGEIPEGTELTFSMNMTALRYVEIRSNNPDTFIALSASCIQAACPTLSLQDVMAGPQAHVQAVRKDPDSSFANPVEYLQGDEARCYYAYYPNQYRDGNNWYQLTLIFPLPSMGDVRIGATPAPVSGESEQEYTNYLPGDDYTHFEIFVTPTPDPNSPAGIGETPLG